MIFGLNAINAFHVHKKKFKSQILKAQFEFLESIKFIQIVKVYLCKLLTSVLGVQVYPLRGKRWLL